MRRLLQPKNIMVSAHHRAREHELGKYISILNIIQVLAAAWAGAGAGGDPRVPLRNTWLLPGGVVVGTESRMIHPQVIGPWEEGGGVKDEAACKMTDGGIMGLCPSRRVFRMAS